MFNSKYLSEESLPDSKNWLSALKIRSTSALLTYTYLCYIMNKCFFMSNTCVYILRDFTKTKNFPDVFKMLNLMFTDFYIICMSENAENSSAPDTHTTHCHLRFDLWLNLYGLQSWFRRQITFYCHIQNGYDLHLSM